MDWGKIAAAGPMAPMEWERQHKLDQRKHSLEYDIGTLPLGKTKEINNYVKVTHDANGGFILEEYNRAPRHFPSSYAVVDYLIHYSNLL